MLKIVLISAAIMVICYTGNAKEFAEHVGVAMWAHVIAALIMSI